MFAYTQAELNYQNKLVVLVYVGQLGNILRMVKVMQEEFLAFSETAGSILWILKLLHLVVKLCRSQTLLLGHL